jgi:uncharacterized protein YjbI with pentapeptide repeats
VGRKKPGRKAEPKAKRRMTWPTWTGFTGKTLWHWLELLGVLAIPVVVAVVGPWITIYLSESQQRVEQNRAQRERVLQEQRTQNEALQAYLDQMSNLVLQQNLKSSEENSEKRRLARARTLTVMERLGPSEKRAAIQFLYESGLIEGGQPVVPLRGADLSGANLSTVDLSGADLSSTDLSNADLSNTDLSSTDLSDALLTGADLTNANLTNANLTNASVAQEQLNQAASLEGATMPDR